MGLLINGKYSFISLMGYLLKEFGIIFSKYCFNNVIMITYSMISSVCGDLISSFHCHFEPHGKDGNQKMLIKNFHKRLKQCIYSLEVVLKSFKSRDNSPDNLPDLTNIRKICYSPACFRSDRCSIYHHLLVTPCGLVYSPQTN